MTLYSLRVEEQDLANGDLVLEAKEGESLRILARGVGGGAADTIVEETIREETMLAYPAVRNRQMDFLGALRERGYRAPELVVPEGHTLRMSSSTGSGTATVLYEELDAGRVDASRPGGPDAKTRTFVSTGQVTESVAAGATETVAVDNSVNPSQLAEWPYEEDVSATYEYDLQALAVALDTGGGANVSLDTFRLTSAEVEFLSRDSSFINPALAQVPDATLDSLPLMFATEPTFRPGADLDLLVQVSNAGSGAEDAIVNACMVFYRRSV
jgi:hypothetical protein